MDDLTLAEAINMKSQLNTVPVEARQLPDPFHVRTGHELRPENSRVFRNLKNTEEYVLKNKMKLNKKNTKLMIFNAGTVRDFMPKFTLEQDELIVVEE